MDKQKNTHTHIFHVHSLHLCTCSFVTVTHYFLIHLQTLFFRHTLTRIAAQVRSGVCFTLCSSVILHTGFFPLCRRVFFTHMLRVFHQVSCFCRLSCFLHALTHFFNKYFCSLCTRSLVAHVHSDALIPGLKIKIRIPPAWCFPTVLNRLTNLENPQLVTRIVSAAEAQISGSPARHFYFGFNLLVRFSH